VGAVYSPAGSIVPISEFPLVVPFTCQMTAELEAFPTTALNCTLPPWKGCAEFGMTVTVAGGGEAGVEVAEEPPVLHDMQLRQSRREAEMSARRNFRGRLSRGTGHTSRG
jgi:hypothetical protein